MGRRLRRMRRGKWIDACVWTAGLLVYFFLAVARLRDHTVGIQPGRISEVPAIRHLGALVCRSFQRRRLDGIDLGQLYRASRCNASCGDPWNSCGLCIGG